MIKTYQSPKLTLAEDEVFMFTSNNSGYHGAGSAGYASFGEVGNVNTSEKHKIVNYRVFLDT